MRAQKLANLFWPRIAIHATHCVVTYNSMYACIQLFLQLIVQWCIMLCIISTSTIKRIARMDSDQGLRHITSGITWAASQDHCSSVVTINSSQCKNPPNPD